ncbi:hypothetical protein LCGC14_2587540 [marine sediment metagenome]|uniref:Uncharacterized protein n=1 Tax=marine sediment metagenome TaxID=412755 RepID=A0A0F9CNR4_9ZZZZ
MRDKVNIDKTVFRKTPDSRWCVKVYKRRNSRLEAYAHHFRCTGASEEKRVYKQEWSWLVGDIPDESKGDTKARCHECGTLVPADILTIIRLHEGQ